MDRFNPFIIEVGVTSPQREVTTGNGNETLEDLSGFPVVTVTGTTQIQVIHKQQASYIPMQLFLKGTHALCRLKH